jgi:hypothetical protein
MGVRHKKYVHQHVQHDAINTPECSQGARHQARSHPGVGQQCCRLGDARPGFDFRRVDQGPRAGSLLNWVAMASSSPC